LLNNKKQLRDKMSWSFFVCRGELALDEKFLNSRIENYWNERSENFGKVRRRELNGADFAAWQKILVEHLPQEKNLKILDVGTGAGFFAILLSKLGHIVTGIDSSAKMIEQAKKLSADFDCNINFQKMDAQVLKFAEESFDVVISRNLTWILPDAMEAYREWCRVLKIGGRLLNFDSDCGKINFEKKSDTNDVHAGIDDKLLAECNDIKNSLRITTHTRPAWDVALLQKLNFTVDFDADISSKVHQDKNCVYDNVALFGIYAVKQ